MKVVQLVMARQYRGAELFALQLSKELMKGGHTVRFISLYKTDGKELNTEGVESLDMAASREGIFNLSLFRKLKKTLCEINPDVVQANAGDTLKYAVLAKILSSHHYKIVFRNASTVSLYIKSPFQKIFYSFIYKFVDRVISVSEFSRRDFIATFPSIEKKIQTIPIALNAAPFSATHIFNKEDFNILHVGGFTFEKNHEGLLRIFGLIKHQAANAKLWLIGDGPLRHEIMTEVKKMNLEGVTFIGTVSNPLDYISSADVLVLPSIIEGLPGVILEAMYCHTPVVAYDVGGISEVVKNGETGWLLKVGDETGFADAVLNVKGSRDIDRIKSNGVKLIVKEFDIRIISQRFLEVYEQVCRFGVM